MTDMTDNLTGSSALVIGGNSGISRAAARALAGLGAHVVLSERDTARGGQVVAAIRAQGGRADFAAARLTDEASARQLARQATDLGGGHVDILVNNAGVLPFGPTHEASEADFDSAFAVNVKAPFFLVAALAPAMAQRGHGAIINITTMVAEFGMAQMGLYGSSKAALVLLTKSWAAEYGPAGIRVNAVSPGPTRAVRPGPTRAKRMGETLGQLASAAPGRPGLPEEIAAAITYLASDAASFIQGAVLTVDGGRIAAWARRHYSLRTATTCAALRRQAPT
jgi:NAD(P)-dependent dehydrogenase (short-subunit alcohol dehydrogenase family)